MNARPEMDEIIRRGKTIYEHDLRSRIEAQHTGKMLALDVDSGDYEIDAEAYRAVQRVRERHPTATPYVIRIGSRTAYRLGARFQARRPS